MTAPARPAPHLAAAPLVYPVNTLVSFHYYKKVNIAALSAGGLRLIGDSGAYSAMSTGAPVKLDEFAGWVLRWRKHLAWVAALDVIGDADGTYRNWRALRDGYGLDTIPTLHYGHDPALVARYVDQGVDYMGLGGMVVHKGEGERLLRWCLRVFRYCRDNHPQLRFHGWGVTHQRLLTTLPWYSVDSSALGKSYRFGLIMLFDPAAGRFITVKADGRSLYAHGTLLRRHYGVGADDLATIGAHNRTLAIRVIGRSYQLFEAHLRRRSQVAPPSYGVNPRAGRHPSDPGGTPVGPNIHLVDGSVANLSKLCEPDDLGDPGPHVHLALGRGPAESLALSQEDPDA